jgi:hypothetical protein
VIHFEVWMYRYTIPSAASAFAPPHETVIVFNAALPRNSTTHDNATSGTINLSQSTFQLGKRRKRAEAQAIHPKRPDIVKAITRKHHRSEHIEVTVASHSHID